MSEEMNFDDHIRQEFKNYSPDVPSHIWDNIVAEKEKRKPVGFWFNLINTKNLVGLIALVVAGSIGGFFISHSLNTANFKTSTNRINTENTAPSQTNNAGKLRIKKENIIAIEETKNPSNTNYGDKRDKRLNSNDTNDITIIQPSLSSTEKNRAASIVKRNHSTFSVQKRTAENNSIDAANNDAITSIKQTKGITTSDDGTTSTTEVTVNKVVVNKGRANSGITGVPIKNYYPGSSRLLFSVVEKPFINISAAQSSLQEKNKAIAHLPECPTIEKDAAGNKRYFEVYIAPDYALRTITDTANSVYLQKRKESTKFSSAFSVGVRYTKVFNNGMSVRAALNFSQINERFTFVQGNLVQVTYIIDPATGDTTGSYTVRGTRYKTTYNHYRSIDIPLTIGYEFGNGRLHTNINAGIIANIYSWQKGDVLDTNYQPVSITTGKGSSAYQFKTNVGLGATAGVSFYYKLTEQLHLLAEPYMRYNFQSMSSDNLTLRQKYTTIGLRLGLRLDLLYPGSVIKR